MKEKCPSCDGKGGYEHNPNPYWMTDGEFMKPMEWKKCHVCRGDGTLSPLALACYRATHIEPPKKPVKFG